MSDKDLEINKKWGASISDRGFAQVPNYLLYINRFLDKNLSSLELMVLIQLVGLWWKKDKQPFPSMATLGELCGVSSRQIQRTINQLIERRMIEKEVRTNDKGLKATNIYKLDPLIDILNEISITYKNIYIRGRKKNDD